MTLTTAQLQALKAHILASPDLAPISSGPSTDYQTVADRLNIAAAPDFYCWRQSMQTSEIGRIISYVALAAMTTANLDRVRTFDTLNPESFDPGRADIRQYMAETFSGALGGQGQATRDALEAAYRDKATRAEKVLATGTGSFAVPAAFGWEGSVDTSIVAQAMAS